MDGVSKMANDGLGAIVAAGVVGVIAWAYSKTLEDNKEAPQPVFYKTSGSNNGFKSTLFNVLGDALEGVSLDGIGLGRRTPPVPANTDAPVATYVAPTVKPKISAGSGLGPSGVDFDAHEAKYGLPKGYLKRTAQIESAMNPNAKNPRSSAGGLFQFINATAKDYGLTNRDRKSVV
jgi:hypothetical protein